MKFIGFYIFVLIALASCHGADQYLYATPITTNEKQCWDQHNLALLSGCWQLGQARMESCYYDADSTPRPCFLSAWSVCFDDKGSSISAVVSLTMDGTEYDCHPTYTAQFNDANQLMIENNEVVTCNNGAFNYNALDEFVCSYQPDGSTSCVYTKKAAPDPDNGTITLLQRVIGQGHGDPTPNMCQ